jgi:protein O-GlcNAc transferase
VNEMMTPSSRTPFRLAAAFVVLAAPALAQSPPEAELAFSTGTMHLREGRADAALASFKQAVKADPKSPYFRRGMGQAYLQKREWKEAIACFRTALELYPDYADVRNDLATALIYSGDREGGKKEFLAVFSDPTNPTPEITARNLGLAYLEEKNYPEAINWFRTSLNRNKAFPDPYRLIAEALVASGRLDEAVAQLEQGVAEIPGDPALLLALGQTLYRAGRFGEARTRLEEAVRKDPTGPAGRAAAEQIKTLPK